MLVLFNHTLGKKKRTKKKKKKINLLSTVDWAISLESVSDPFFSCDSVRKVRSQKKQEPFGRIDYPGVYVILCMCDMYK